MAYVIPGREVGGGGGAGLVRACVRCVLCVGGLAGSWVVCRGSWVVGRLLCRLRLGLVGAARAIGGGLRQNVYRKAGEQQRRDLRMEALHILTCPVAQARASGPEAIDAVLALLRPW